MKSGNVEVEVMLWMVLIIASVTDIYKGKIYNFLTFPVMGMGIVYHGYSLGISGVFQSIFSAFVVFAMCFPLYWIQAFSAGDIKLLMGIATWSGVAFSSQLGFYALLVGAIVGLILLIKTHGFLKGGLSVWSHLKEPVSRKKQSLKMPFAPAFLTAFLLIKILEFL